MNGDWALALVISAVALSGWTAYGVAAVRLRRERDARVRERLASQREVDRQRVEADTARSMSLHLSEKVIRMRRESSGS